MRPQGLIFSNFGLIITHHIAGLAAFGWRAKPRSFLMPKILPTRAQSAVSNADEVDFTDPPLGEIVHRPDGFHWLAPDGRQEFGPFTTRAEAIADRDEANDGTPSPGESLEEAEDELGQASWIDPDTGELAEGQSRPRLDD
jgi:hypothetical protein